MNVECPHCNEVFELPDDHDVDSEFQCPNCEEKVQPSDLPSVEPEDCETCRKNQDFEYEGNFVWRSGGWTCESCGGAV